MKYEQEAKDIIEYVGGRDNVMSLVHCATRLRFQLNDTALAQKKSLETMKEVLSVVNSGGQYQVVIGSQVSDYYRDIMDLLGLKENLPVKKEEKTPVSAKLFELISGAFSPLIPMLAGAGMIKALLTVLTTLGWMSDASSTYAILSAAGNAVFYFLPVFLGITLAKKAGANAYVGGAIGAALLEPGFTALIGVEGVTLLGIGITPIDYASSVFPIFVTILIYSLLHKALTKIIWKDVQLFIVPMLSLMIMVPLTVIVFGPVGTTAGNIISDAVMWLIDKNKLLAGMVLGGGMPFMVVFGLHWGFTPVTLQNLAVLGGDPIEGAAVAAVFAEIGVAIGFFLRGKKHSKLRALAGPTAITGLLAGVTEPIVYGLILRYKRAIPIVAAAGAIGGGICGVLGVTCNAYVFHNVFSMPVYTPFFGYLLGIGSALLIGAVLTYFFGLSKEELAEEHSELPAAPAETDEFTEKIYSPLSGTKIIIEEIRDEVFASGALGTGIGVLPSDGFIYAPADGIISTVFPTKHAIGMKTTRGTEILIHLGLDTVTLDGKYFDIKVTDGDAVKQGDLLGTFDKEQLEAENFSMVTPVLILNSEADNHVTVEHNGLVDRNTVIMTIIHRREQ